MYVPAHFAADDVSELLSRRQAADLVTMTGDGLVATFLPFVHDGGSLLGHVARNNDQWSRPVIGELRIHDDVEWLDALVRRLTDLHEAAEPSPWSVDDAPPAFVAGQLRAIVGVELVISRIEAKIKMSQNRPPADVDGVVAGLEVRGDHAGATAVRAANG